MAEQESYITGNGNIEVKKAFDNFDFNLTINSRRVRKLSNFSNYSSERLNYMKLNRERMLLRKEDELFDTELRIRNMQSSVCEADGMDVPKWCSAKRDYRMLENDIVRIKNEMQEIIKILEDRRFPLKDHIFIEELKRVEKEFNEESEEFDVTQMQLGPESCLERLQHDFRTKMTVDVKSNDRIENRKWNPSVRLIQNNDYIEDRREYSRKEVLTNRRDSKMRVANLNRGLVMDKEASKTDSTFDLTPLDEALPSVLNSSKNPSRNKLRNLKIQEKVTNYMKEKRLHPRSASGLLFSPTAASGPLLSATADFGPLLSSTAASDPLLSITAATESLPGFPSLYEFHAEWENSPFFT